MTSDYGSVSWGECFLCVPDRRLVFAESEHFYAMLGLGPIVPGYSLIATKAHTRSLMDIQSSHDAEFLAFRGSVETMLEDAFAESILFTEHGRVPVCEVHDRNGHEAHCYHAHSLCFPVRGSIADRLASDFSRDAQVVLDWSVAKTIAGETECEYIYHERTGEPCMLIPAPFKHIRQYCRLLVAEMVGQPELASWKKHPRLDVVEEGRDRLGLR